MDRRWSAALVGVTLLGLVAGATGCGSDPGGVSDRDVDLTTTISGRSSALVIEYVLTNTGDQDLVVYHRLADDPGEDEFVSDVNRVYVTRTDGRVEIAKKIDHPCQDEPDTSDCPGAAPVTWRIGGTVLAPGEELSERITLPARGRGGFIETRGMLVRFCAGVAVIDEDNPAPPDGLYPPTSPQTVVCGDEATVPD